MNLNLPKWAHVALTIVALAVPWVLGTLFPALGVAVPALVANVATMVVSVVNSLNAEQAVTVALKRGNAQGQA